MVITRIGSLGSGTNPLELIDMPVPIEGENDLLVRVSACGVCHTEIDEIEGRTAPAFLPIIPGHQIVGRVERAGKKVTKFKTGDRVGVAWIHSSCGKCRYCAEGNDNLCDNFKATGRDVHGGYAEFTLVPEDYAFPIPPSFPDIEAAPLLCSGAIGYRSLRFTDLQDGENLGLTGFGASAHLVIQMALHMYPRSKIFVFARSESERGLARELGAFWTGRIEDDPSEKLHAIIDTTPAWKPILESMKNLRKGGRLVVNAIRKESTDKESLLDLDYPTHLWLEKELKSVANVARWDVSKFLELAAEIPIRPEIQIFDLEEANRAVAELRESKIRGAKVLKIGQ
jgi:propanol-preferring alcohol dehydrogenase